MKSSWAWKYSKASKCDNDDDDWWAWQGDYDDDNDVDDDNYVDDDDDVDDDGGGGGDDDFLFCLLGKFICCWAWAINRKSFWSQFQILSNFNGFPLKGLQQGFPQESNCQSAFWLENIKMREILSGNEF